ncbi:hypothetical protein Vqi01_24030 [Micromonospora qiuiae]|uniref:Uncharacterized protein n=1 Tax=Micromonospora qiuiae TaxID=502268 RepID=A0ABQ4JAN9_9ACTN|nr:hypothetical protein Vqi01_24030 [Micromonospora qiuiae]
MSLDYWNGSGRRTENLVNRPSAHRCEDQQRAEGIDDPVRGAVRHPEQRADLAGATAGPVGCRRWRHRTLGDQADQLAELGGPVNGETDSGRAAVITCTQAS